MNSSTHPWARSRIRLGQDIGAGLAADCAGFRVLRLAPPYTRFEPVAQAGPLRPEQLPFGSLLVVAPPTHGVDWSALRPWVRGLRGRLPGCPVIMRVARTDPGEVARLACYAAQLGIRATIVEEEKAPRTAIARQMLEPPDLGGAIVEWLCIRGLTAAAGPEIADIFRRASEYHHLHDLDAATGTVERTLRDQFHKLGQPAPGKWYHAARGIHAALQLQRRVGQSVSSVAVELGYCHGSGLSHHLIGLFGTGASLVQGLLGWEPLMDRWMARHWPARNRR